MRQAGFTRATSVSFLVDRKGIVRWVHPGPRILYSAKPEDASADADMRGLEAAVGLVLEEARQARAREAAKQAQAAPPAFPAPK
jgi:hypothetical protein